LAEAVLELGIKTESAGDFNSTRRLYNWCSLPSAFIWGKRKRMVQARECNRCDADDGPYCKEVPVVVIAGHH
jgi:hypothetical protein